jgi:ATP-dependent protease ClpP protease subunit
MLQRPHSNMFKPTGQNNLKGGPKNTNDKPKVKNNESDSGVSSVGNNIYFHDDVCDESVAKLITIINNKNDEFKKMLLNDMVKSAKPRNLWLHITSYGGCLFSCFRAIDAIKNSKIPIYTVIDGYAASAGTLMSVVGKKRYMTRSSYMLIHQLSSGTCGNFWQIKDEYENLEMLMDDIYNIYTEHSKMSRKELEAYLSHDSWWKLDKCIECGLVDKVYTGK